MHNGGAKKSYSKWGFGPLDVWESIQSSKMGLCQWGFGHPLHGIQKSCWFPVKPPGVKRAPKNRDPNAGSPVVPFRYGPKGGPVESFEKQLHLKGTPKTNQPCYIRPASFLLGPTPGIPKIRKCSASLGHLLSYGCGSTPMGSHFGVGEFTAHFGLFLWGLGCSLGYDLGFDPSRRGYGSTPKAQGNYR